MNQVHRTLIVAAQDQSLAQALTSGLAGEAGSGMFVVPLSATGASPASHYISNGMIDESFAGILGDADATFAAAQEIGASVTLDAIQGLYSRAIIKADADPFQVMADAGLQFVQVDTPL
jgi:hypothetical protein